MQYGMDQMFVICGTTPVSPQCGYVFTHAKHTHMHHIRSQAHAHTHTPHSLTGTRTHTHTHHIHSQAHAHTHTPHSLTGTCTSHAVILQYQPLTLASLT